MSTLFLSLKSLPLSRASLSFSGCRRGLCKAVLGLFILIFAGAVLPAACITDASNPGCAHLALPNEFELRHLHEQSRYVRALAERASVEDADKYTVFQS